MRSGRAMPGAVLQAQYGLLLAAPQHQAISQYGLYPQSVAQGLALADQQGAAIGQLQEGAAAAPAATEQTLQAHAGWQVQRGGGRYVELRRSQQFHGKQHGRGR